MSISNEISHLASTAPSRIDSLFPVQGVQNDYRQQVHEFEQSLATHNTVHETPHTLFSPMHYEPGHAYPLIVWLHGRSSAAERQLMKIMPIISMRNYVAVAPRGIAIDPLGTESVDFERRNVETSVPSLGNINTMPCRAKVRQEKKQTPDSHHYGWNVSDCCFNEAQKRVFDVVQIASEKCHVAKRRIYLAGFGDGGTMAFRIAMQFPRYFAGVVALCGGFPQSKLPLVNLQQIRSLPCLMSVGRDSKEFSPNDAAKQLMLFHTAGMAVTVRQYPCRQELSTQMLEDVNRWIMERIPYTV